MRIDELDEFQGVTPQLVTDWLLANGWTQNKPRWWERGEDGFLFDSETFDQQWFWTHALAAIYTSGKVQALLSKINPRMRAGIPSQEARDAHQGAWVGHSGGHRRNITIGLWDGPEFVRGPIRAGHPNAWSYWPVDHSGNKVRWPTDEQGEML